MTTASTRPSPSKSPKAAPRCRAARATQLRDVYRELSFRRFREHEIALLRLSAEEELGIVLHVAAGDEDVLVAVVVEVEDAGAPAAERQGRGADEARMRHVEEEALAEIAEQREGLVGQRGDEQVVAAVVVEIAEIDAHGGEGVAVVVEGDARPSVRSR